MNPTTDKIRFAQAKVYEHLVKHGKVTPQIAESQPVSESMQSIIIDAIRVAKDDAAVAAAAAAALNMFNLICAGRRTSRALCRPAGWLVGIQ